MTLAVKHACSFARIFQRRVRQLAGDQCGVSAVEFALLLPLMIAVYLGVVELSQGISAQRKVTLTTRTIADLVSQASNMSNNDMTNSLKATTAVMAPFSDANVKVTVSSIAIDANGNATVKWSDSNKGAARTKAPAVPAGLIIPNTRSWLVLSEVEYAFKPTIGYVISGTLTLKDHMYMRPRLSDCITREGVPSACPS